MSSASLTGLAGKYLTVGIDREVFGIPVLQVREIIRLQKITPVPQVPAAVKGVINLRGRVIPILDLRALLGVGTDLSDRSCIVVVQVAPGARVLSIGLIVDSVEEVVSFAADQIEAPPELAAGGDGAYLRALAKVNGAVKLLLDIDHVVAATVAEELLASAA